MAPKKTHCEICGDPANDPSGTEEDRVKFARLTSALYDISTNTFKNEEQLLTEVMTDMEPATGMNGGLIVFVEDTSKLGGTIQVLHNVAVNPRGDHQNVAFSFYNDVKDRAVEFVPFKKAFLVETDEVIVLDTMARLLHYFTTNEALDLVGLYAAGDPFTQKIYTRNAMFLPCALIPHMMGQNLKLKSVICILVPVMNSLGLVLP